MSQGQWYYCLDHRTVEPYDGCRSADRLGPYPTQQDAQDALEHVHERNEAWDTDPRFNDEDEDEDAYDAEERREREEHGGFGPFRF